MNPNNQNTALLIMDMQTAIVRMLPSDNVTPAKVAKAITHARANKIPVIYVVVGFRPGMPEISMNNKGFTATKERLSNTGMDEWMKIDPSVNILPGDVVITKRRISAFTGSDLEVVLRAKRIEHIVLTGISTSGVVLSTIREAADKDYRISVLSDGCADADPEVHNVLTTKVFPRQTEVMTVDEWIKM